jgi:hypothetical protein
MKSAWIPSTWEDGTPKSTCNAFSEALATTTPTPDRSVKGLLTRNRKLPTGLHNPQTQWVGSGERVAPHGGAYTRAKE